MFATSGCVHAKAHHSVTTFSCIALRFPELNQKTWQHFSKAITNAIIKQKKNAFLPLFLEKADREGLY